MTTQALVVELLNHNAPHEVVSRMEEALRSEKKRRGEFRQWLEPDVKAEFILGEVVVHSPATEGHNGTVFRISMLLGTHCTLTEAGTTRMEKALVETARNDYEPDVSVWLSERAADFTDDMLYYPPPDLVVEVLSKSTEDRDRGVKHDDYCREGVSEYWIVDPRVRRVQQYRLGTGYEGENIYRETEISGQDTLTSSVLPGFSVPVASFFYTEPFAGALRTFSVGE
jgi:Uma2 family endonuclease